MIQAPTVAELLARGEPTFSFEFFPPKSDLGEQYLWQALRELEPLRPSFVSMTYGAGGSSRDRTVAITRQIASDTTMTPVGHLTVVGHSVSELRHVIGSYADAGVRSVLALRGDPPGDPNGPWPSRPDGFDHAADLVRLLRESGDFCVGVAAFPEGHPRSQDRKSDLAHFIAKCRAGASFAITQMFFRAEDYLRLRDDVAAECEIPIIPGIMPITNVSQIERMATLSGAAFPSELAERLRANAVDPEAICAIGIDVATHLASRLLAEGAPGIHLMTLNRSQSSRMVYERLMARSPVTADQAP